MNLGCIVTGPGTYGTIGKVEIRKIRRVGLDLIEGIISMQEGYKGSEKERGFS